MVLSTLRLYPSRPQRRQVLSILRSVQGPTGVKPHCRASHLYEEDGYEEAILYLECWDSEGEFERHARSDSYRRVLEAMELSRKPPELTIYPIAEIRGMDWIEALRGLPSELSAPTTT